LDFFLVLLSHCISSRNYPSPGIGIRINDKMQQKVLLLLLSYCLKLPFNIATKKQNAKFDAKNEIDSIEFY